MASKITGDPDQTWGGIAVADVVRALRDLEPGFHTVAEVRARYLELTGQPDGPAANHVSRIVSGLGMTRFMRGGEMGWRFERDRIAPRWPRLPWSD